MNDGEVVFDYHSWSRESKRLQCTFHTSSILFWLILAALERLRALFLSSKLDNRCGDPNKMNCCGSLQEIEFVERLFSLIDIMLPLLPAYTSKIMDDNFILQRLLELKYLPISMKKRIPSISWIS